MSAKQGYPHPRRRGYHGYTLLEILVVLVIISIVSSVALLAVGHNHNKQLEAFAAELTQTISLAEEQALLQPTTLGFLFNATSFGFYEYRQDQAHASWKALGDPELGMHPLPDNIQISLKTPEQSGPALVISPNGTPTPFRLLIGYSHEAPRYEIVGTASGSVTSRRYQG